MRKTQGKQPEWESIVGYALKCVKAEQTRTWVAARPGEDGPRWYADTEPEMLITGRGDEIRAPEALRERLDGAGASKPAIAYGYPSVVVKGLEPPESGRGKRTPCVTPMFIVQCKATKDAEGWKLTATHEPELNTNALSQQENAEEIERIGKLDLPYGDLEGMVEIIQEAADLLGYELASLDPDTPGDSEQMGRGVEGAYATGVFIEASHEPFRVQVEEELEELAKRKDWTDTAAAALLGMKTHGREKEGKARTPLKASESQEQILEAVRRQGLTVVTGPPGTGKTQMVVNAVANAWLDGETMLLASTNNAAVDVGVSRAEREIGRGLLIRTGNRSARQEVPEKVSAAQAEARKYCGERLDRQRRKTERARRRWEEASGLSAEAHELDIRITEEMGRREELVEEREESEEAMGGVFTEEDRAKARNAWAEWKEAESAERSSVPAAGYGEGTRSAAGPLAGRPWTRGTGTAITKRARESKGIFGFAKQRDLCREVGVAVDTPMARLAAWADAWEKEELGKIEVAKRRKTEAQRRSRRREAASVALEKAFRTTGEAVKRKAEEWLTLERKIDEAARRIQRLRKQREALEERCPTAQELRRLETEWGTGCLAEVRAAVAERIEDGAGELPAFAGVPMHRNPFRQAVRRALRTLPAWGCTNLAAAGSFPLEAGFFDVAVVDEASQCSLADVLPIAYRAKRLVVVGDPNQMRPIAKGGDVSLRKAAEESGLDEGDLSSRGLHHREGSAYDAFRYAAGEKPDMLDEHYRCHPRIAGWFNRTFYGGGLEVLTAIENGSGQRAIEWRDAPGKARRPRPQAGVGRRRGGWVNAGQARAAAQIVDALGTEEGTIGVVAPYAAQAELIEHFVREKGEERLKDREWVCGTAHRLQGNERDVVVFTTTMSAGMPASATKWVDDNRNLMNVAVSRARRRLIVIGDPELSPDQSGTLFSLREYIRRTSKEADQGGAVVHSGAEAKLLEAMESAGLSPLAKPDVDGYELDFALFDGEAKLNVEVDGDHHRDRRGRRRRSDLARDAVLEEAGWRVMRIPAWRCNEEAEAAAAEVAERFKRLYEA